MKFTLAGGLTRGGGPLDQLPDHALKDDDEENVEIDDQKLTQVSESANQVPAKRGKAMAL